MIYAAKTYILYFSLNFNDFLYTLAPLLLMVVGISEGLNGIGDFPNLQNQM